MSSFHTCTLLKNNSVQHSLTVKFSAPPPPLTHILHFLNSCNVGAVNTYFPKKYKVVSLSTKGAFCLPQGRRNRVFLVIQTNLMPQMVSVQLLLLCFRETYLHTVIN